MNNKELKAVRLKLQIEPGEAACHIANKDVRTWQRWEAGVTAVPQYVIDIMEDYNQIHTALMEERHAEFHRKGDQIALKYYLSVDEFQAETGEMDLVMWRLMNSVAGECYCAGIAYLE